MNNVTDVTDRALTMIAVIDSARIAGFAPAYPDDTYQRMIRDLMGTVADLRAAIDLVEEWRYIHCHVLTASELRELDAALRGEVDQ